MLFYFGVLNVIIYLNEEGVFVDIGMKYSDKDNPYTGRKIAIFTDAHALYEPTKAVLDDIKRRGINEIYSLGDNVGVGPNPGEVIDLLEERGVKSISGNSEDYITLGKEPFVSYFTHQKEMSLTWTLCKLNENQIGIINLYPHFIELMVGGKRVGLCHFANDVRIDFDERSTWTYKDAVDQEIKGYEQFNYTNSEAQKREVDSSLNYLGPKHPQNKGFLSAKNEPLFNMKKIEYFHAIIQGHVHFKIYESSKSTEFYTIRAVGMGYDTDPVDTASYVILNEKENGFDVEEILVKYDREKMISSILNCTSPDKTIFNFTNITAEEVEKKLK